MLSIVFWCFTESLRFSFCRPSGDDALCSSVIETDTYSNSRDSLVIKSNSSLSPVVLLLQVLLPPAHLIFRLTRSRRLMRNCALLLPGPADSVHKLLNQSSRFYHS